MVPKLCFHYATNQLWYWSLLRILSKWGHYNHTIWIYYLRMPKYSLNIMMSHIFGVIIEDRIHPIVFLNFVMTYQYFLTIWFLNIVREVVYNSQLFRIYPVWIGKTVLIFIHCWSVQSSHTGNMNLPSRPTKFVLLALNFVVLGFVLIDNLVSLKWNILPIHYNS